ncbi:Putative palmitoyltransferase ZDHHC12 [Fukomys damarensis]|uniref:Putative palmitoyltransferase ZDHHC12 n=1 Tax=Fukomys damarensis TaxID=885580 RepID=A0A091D5N1_FUKDA|nr:Putative palmitoyltransferase ZDHHC12 [Fukomys damarensis]
MAPWVLLSPEVLVWTWEITLVPYRASAMGGAGGAAAAPHLPAPGAGLPPALPGCVAHGPGLCEQSAPALGGAQGRADSHGAPGRRPAGLQILPGAVAQEDPELPTWWCSWQCCPGACTWHGLALTPSALGAVAAVQWAPLHHLPAAVPLLPGGWPAPGLPPLPPPTTMSSHCITYFCQCPSNPFDSGLTRNLFFCGWPTSSVGGPRAPGTPCRPRTTRSGAAARTLSITGGRLLFRPGLGEPRIPASQEQFCLLEEEGEEEGPGSSGQLDAR